MPKATRPHSIAGQVNPTTRLPPPHTPPTRLSPSQRPTPHHATTLPIPPAPSLPALPPSSTFAPNGLLHCPGHRPSPSQSMPPPLSALLCPTVDPPLSPSHSATRRSSHAHVTITISLTAADPSSPVETHRPSPLPLLCRCRGRQEGSAGQRRSSAAPLPSAFTTFGPRPLLLPPLRKPSPSHPFRLPQILRPAHSKHQKLPPLPSSSSSIPQRQPLSSFPSDATAGFFLPIVPDDR